MKWQVIWRPSAEQDLAALWLNPAWRSEVTQATARIDRQLQQDPIAFSESRWDDVRIMFEPPYGLIFVADVASSTVYVVHFWRYRKRA